MGITKKLLLLLSLMLIVVSFSSCSQKEQENNKVTADYFGDYVSEIDEIQGDCCY